jgi:hypothetical protein
MLRITIPACEKYDESKNEFVSTKEQTLQLEHSLVSLSKWEAKWCKPFLSKKGLTNEEALDYIRCMTLTQNVPPEVYNNIPNYVIDQVTEYINAPMTATWFSDEKKGRANNETVTSELIYYWMIALNIPSEYQKWHLNRLLTLIRICNVKNEPPKKMGPKELRSRNAALNAARRKQYGTRG